MTNVRLAAFAVPSLVDGAIGAVVAPRGRLRLVLRLSVEGGQITDMEVIADPSRLVRVELAILDPVSSWPALVPDPTSSPGPTSS